MNQSEAIQNVLSSVSKEAKDEIVGILAGAFREAEELLSASEKETKKEVERILTASHRMAETRSRRIVGEAEIAARNKSLQLVEETVNSILQVAIERMKDDAGSHSEEVLEKLLRESLAFVEADAVRVYGTSKDRRTLSRIVSKVSKEIRRKLTIDETPLNSSGGIRVSSMDGSISYDNTFESRLERAKPILRRKLSTILSKEA